MKRVLLSVPLIVMLASGTAGCSHPNACPAIGWSNSATVILQGPVETVGSVEFCADGTCSVPAPKPTTAPKATVKPEASFVPGQASPGAPAARGTPVSTSKYGPYLGRKVDDSTWQFNTTMSAPKKATVRAMSASGEVLAERDVDLAWTRVGGSEQCGGPATAGPITLSLR
ncbi:hypothetical protein [Arthrobacter sp. ISL-28]|uniref:hypothetical protein n=1 Tax=Arthrobacter sp. ISL-28 TaxID=2819108 RepID=UPI001BECB60B|nr:hypothetical protein [Arthrobacter sp. ISL-28]MBT2522036.1 hypothetical protein [Arthrobacter sp. ISL-28]